MGLPKILIEFKTLAETIIKRSERGIVAVIVKDNSNTAETQTYTKESEITKSHYTAANLGYLSLVFKGNPSKVIVERVASDGNIETALERLKNKQWYYLTVPGIADNEVSTVETYIKSMRNDFHKTFKAVLPALANEFITLLKETSVAAYIGVADLTQSGILIRSITFSNFMPLVAIAVIYWIMVIILTKLVSLLERRLRQSER